MKKSYSTESTSRIIAQYIFLLCLFIFPRSVQAAQVDFAWRANPSEDNILGYKLYFGTKTTCGDSASCQFDGQSSTRGLSPIDIPVTDLSDPGNPSYNLDGLDEGDWCFRLTAYNKLRESNPTPPLTMAIDTIGPSVSMTTPTTAASFITTSGTITIAGDASDNLCIASITWTNNRGGGGTASGTTSWAQDGIVLQEGDNLITVTAKDFAGNTAGTSLTVTYAPPPPDTESPLITITSPTSSVTYEAGSSKLNIAGTAADNVELVKVTWINNRGGSGTASGTTSWSVANIALSEGSNLITVTATDTSNNIATDTLTVSFTLPPETYTEEFGEAADTDYAGTCLDTYINAGAAGTNKATEAYLNTYTWPTDVSANRIIMKWDLSAIPSSATIQNAILYLYATDTGGDSQYEISAHKIINRNPDINSCTWNTYDGINSWSGGADGAAQDMASAEDSRIVDQTSGEYKAWSITDMVADWVASPEENYGLLLESDTSATTNSYRSFSSSDNSDNRQRPKLVVTYSTETTFGTTPPTFNVKIKLNKNPIEICFTPDRLLKADPFITLESGKGFMIPPSGARVNPVNDPCSDFSTYCVDYVPDADETLIDVRIDEDKANPVVPDDLGYAIASFLVTDPDHESATSFCVFNSLGGDNYLLDEQCEEFVSVECDPGALDQPGLGLNPDECVLMRIIEIDPATIPASPGMMTTGLYDITLPDGVEIAQGKTITITFGFNLTNGLKRKDFDNGLWAFDIFYFDDEISDWKSSGITIKDIQWDSDNSGIIVFTTTHLTKFVVSVSSPDTESDSGFSDSARTLNTSGSNAGGGCSVAKGIYDLSTGSILTNILILLLPLIINGAKSRYKQRKKADNMGL